MLLLHLSPSFSTTLYSLINLFKLSNGFLLKKINKCKTNFLFCRHSPPFTSLKKGTNMSGTLKY